MKPASLPSASAMEQATAGHAAEQTAVAVPQPEPRRLEERTTGVDQSDSDEEEPAQHAQFDLWQLIKSGCQSSCARRVKKGLVNVADTDASGWTYLHAAAYYGAERTTAALIKAGAHLHTTSNTGETPLHLAAKWPHEKVVEALLKAGANPNALSKRGRTPAHTASQFARRGALELIINAGGDVSIQDVDGNTPLHLAAKSTGPGPNEVVRMLLRAKCRMDVANKDVQMPLHNVQNLQSLVVFAAMESLPELMTALTRRGGIKLDVFDASGMTPLQTAAFKGDLAVARALLAGGAKVNFQASPSWAPCPSLAAAADNPLVGHSPNGTVKPLGDRSPLHFAAERGATQMMELLISAGAKVNNTSNEGLISPLHIAVWNQQAEAVRVLLANKADVKARVNKNGMAPLHFACNAPAAKLEIISMLLDAKADIEERCSDGLTPLMLAAQMAPADAVRLLLVRGARVQARGRRGMTAVDCAEGRADILLVLAQHCTARSLTEIAAKANQLAIKAARITARNGQQPLLTLPDATGGATAAAGSSSTSNSRSAASTTAPASSSTATALPPSATGAATAPALAQAASMTAGAGSSGGAAGAGLIDQLKQQLSTTSAQLYAWAAAANTRGGGPASPNTSTGGAGSSLQQLLGNMGLPASLADMGSSPLASSSRDPMANVPLMDSNPQTSTGTSAQMLSCITAIVSNQSDGGLARNRRGDTRTRKRTISTANAPSQSQASASGVVIEEISSVAHTPAHTRATTGAAATGTHTTTVTRTAASTATGTAAAAAAAAPVAVPGVCSCHAALGGTAAGAGGAGGGSKTPLAAGITVCTCSVAPDSGVLQVSEHQMHLKCAAGCKFAFHLPCWKVVRDQLRQLRPDFPPNFTQVPEPPQCIGRNCPAKISQVSMEGPAGTQVVYPPSSTSTLVARPAAAPAPSPMPAYTPPPAPTATITATLTFAPANSPYSPHHYAWVGDKPSQPTPPPMPQVVSTMLLPPPDLPSLMPPPLANLTSVTITTSDSPTGSSERQVRRKRRAARDSGGTGTSEAGAGPGAGSGLMHVSGELLQGRNPPTDATAAGATPCCAAESNDPAVAAALALARAGLEASPTLARLRAGLDADPSLALVKAGLEADLDAWAPTVASSSSSSAPAPATASTAAARAAAPAASATAAAAAPATAAPAAATNGTAAATQPAVAAAAAATVRAKATPAAPAGSKGVVTANADPTAAAVSTAPWTQLEASVVGRSGRGASRGGNGGAGAKGSSTAASLVDLKALPIMDLRAEASGSSGSETAEETSSKETARNGKKTCLDPNDAGSEGGSTSGFALDSEEDSVKPDAGKRPIQLVLTPATAASLQRAAGPTTIAVSTANGPDSNGKHLALSPLQVVVSGTVSGSARASDSNGKHGQGIIPTAVQEASNSNGKVVDTSGVSQGGKAAVVPQGGGKAVQRANGPAIANTSYPPLPPPVIAPPTPFAGAAPTPTLLAPILSTPTLTDRLDPALAPAPAGPPASAPGPAPSPGPDTLPTPASALPTTTLPAPAGPPTTLPSSPSDIVYDAINALAVTDLTAETAGPFLLVTCADVALLSKTPGMVEVWMQQHVASHGPIVSSRLLSRYCSFALCMGSSGAASSVHAALQGGVMLLSPMRVTPLREFPDDAAIAAKAQQVAMAKNQAGGNSWMTEMVDCWRILQELPPVTHTPAPSQN